MYTSIYKYAYLKFTIIPRYKKFLTDSSNTGTLVYYMIMADISYT